MKDSSTLVISSKKLKISMDSRLVRWNTARLVNNVLRELQFFYNYEVINQDIYKLWKHLKVYTNANYARGNIRHGEDLYDSLIKHLDNMVEFQKLVDSTDDTNELGKTAKQMFDNSNVRSSQAVDPEIIEMVNVLAEYAKPIRLLFNNILSLTERGRDPRVELINEIQEILMNKGLDQFEIPEHLLITNEVKTTEKV